VPGRIPPAGNYFAAWRKSVDQQLARLSTQSTVTNDAYAAGGLSCTSTSVTELAGAPSVTATIGMSGDCVMTYSAYIGGAAANTGYVWLMVDGTNYGGGNAFLQANAGIDTARSIRFKLYTGSTLSQGSHTFSMGFSNSTTSALAYYFCCVSIQPL
jgi:hypothetical protein